jgi:hypothetical protein
MGEPFRVVVTGSRHWTDTAAVIRALALLPPNTHLAHGNARGADRIAAKAAKELGFKVTPYDVDEALDGPWPAAGHRRNERMIDSHRPHLVTAFRAGGKSNGTDGAVDYAKCKGITVKLVKPTGSGATDG